MTFNVVYEINSKIVRALRENLMPWKRRWNNAKNFGFPTNVCTKRPYRGAIAVLLDLVAHQQGFHSKWWGTFHEWQILGGETPENTCGTKIILFDEIGCGKEVIPQPVVFNADQIAGVDKYEVQGLCVRSPAEFPEAERVIRATGADIRPNFRPRAVYFYPPLDYIVLPSKRRYRHDHCLPGYYETAFHELAHWSEHRLSWSGTYELAELRAEICSAFLGQVIGVPNIYGFEPTPNHQKYVDAWITGMEADPWMVFHIAEQASEAVDFILSFSDPSAG